MTRNEHLLVIAIEECNEVAQRLSKALRFGLEEIQPGQSLTNTERIRYEYSDLAAVLEMIAPPTAAGGVIHPPNGKAMDAKREKVEHFLRYSAEIGTLTSPPPAAETPRQCSACHEPIDPTEPVAIYHMLCDDDVPSAAPPVADTKGAIDG